MSEQIKFYKGNESDLSNAQQVAGGIYHCEDTKNTYLSDGTEMKYFATAVGHTTQGIDGAEVFNNYNKNKSLATYSSASGSETYVNVKYFYGLFTINSGSCTMTLFKDAAGNTPAVFGTDFNWVKSDLICIISKNNKKIVNGSNLKISKVENNVITLPSLTTGNIDTEYQNLDAGMYYIIWNHTRPEDGVLYATTLFNKEITAAHAEGLQTGALDQAAHAEGRLTIASGRNAHVEGAYGKAQGEASHAEGYNTQANGKYSHTEGQTTMATSICGHAEGTATLASGNYSHAEGQKTTASGANSHAEGTSSKATGTDSHAEGNQSSATGTYSHAEGRVTTAAGSASHAEGNNSKTGATADAAHAEGQKTNANGKYSHAEGFGTTVEDQAQAAHAEGFQTTASGQYSHAEGYKTSASRDSAHAEGDGTKSRTFAAHAEGWGTVTVSSPTTNAKGQHVQGRFNIDDNKENINYAHIVGNGTEKTFDDQGNEILDADGNSVPNRSNAHTIDWSGNAWFAGNIKIGGNSYNSVNAKTVATADRVEALETALGNLTNVMNFVGSTTSEIKDGETVTINKPTGITTATYTPYSGDVVIDNKGQECVFDGYTWRHIGDASYAATAGHALTADIAQSAVEAEHTPQADYAKTAGFADSASHADQAENSVVAGYASEAGCLTIEEAIGSTVKPVYFDESGKPIAINYSIESNVPADAVFTDTTYEVFSTSNDGIVPKPTTASTNLYLRADGTWSTTVGRKTPEGGEIFNNYSLNQAPNTNAHAEGAGTTAYGIASHAEGYNTIAAGDYSHAAGSSTHAEGANSHAEGFKTHAQGSRSHAEGESTQAIGAKSHAEGVSTKAHAEDSHAEGRGTESYGQASHAEGHLSTTHNDFAHAEGYDTRAKGNSSHSEGYVSEAVADYSHAEGYNTKAEGISSHTEGHATSTTASYAHAEGISTHAEGVGAHAEGESTYATGAKAHAEGTDTRASGSYSHAEGHHTKAVGEASHAEGYHANANGKYSHAEGQLTIAAGTAQHVQGKWNIEDTSVTTEKPYGTYAHILGNGTSDSNRKNAHTIDWNGNAWFAGDIKIGGNNYNSTSATSIKAGLMTSAEKTKLAGIRFEFIDGTLYIYDENYNG